MTWYEYLNPWSYLSPTGKLNPFAIEGIEETTEKAKGIMSSFAKPKSLILPGLIIGGLAFYFLVVKK